MGRWRPRSSPWILAKRSPVGWRPLPVLTRTSATRSAWPCASASSTPCNTATAATPARPMGLVFAFPHARWGVGVRDQGAGFDLALVPNPLADEHLLKTSGRGLFLARCFMDDLQVECGRNGGAVVTLIKRYSSNHREGAGAPVEKEKRQ